MPSKLQDYDVLGEIGSGSYGTCKKVRRKSDQKVRFEICKDEGMAVQLVLESLTTEIFCILFMHEGLPQ